MNAELLNLALRGVDADRKLTHFGVHWSEPPEVNHSASSIDLAAGVLLLELFWGGYSPGKNVIVVGCRGLQGMSADVPECLADRGSQP